MPDHCSLGLRYHREPLSGGPELLGANTSLQILDQTALPDEERWLDASDPLEMLTHITRLRVRGAPMIGVCAALSLACAASRGQDAPTLRRHALKLRAARPTAVNLMAAIDRLLAVLDTAPKQLVVEAERVFTDDRALCEALARRGSRRIRPGDAILTHCNTGGLATAGVGTALGAIRRAHEQGKGITVWVDETRPLLQGGRLTAWELEHLQIPYHLITDSTAGLLMARGQVDRVLVGADRIAANGDFANKIGTYSLAVLAHHHGVPFHVVAPRTTVDPACPDGAVIPIEERAADEVRGLSGRLRWAPMKAPVFNPAFDVTPADLVTSWILDDAELSPQDVGSGGLLT
ncbi:MAG: S-methyl-5-thioribose-1-phosphate isomerase [Oligoflexia bacterium]|nr:S-methyl-5-thioribose-1-phosphate isomerase [Oligoflexia bacterium]